MIEGARLRRDDVQNHGELNQLKLTHGWGKGVGKESRNNGLGNGVRGTRTPQEYK